MGGVVQDPDDPRFWLVRDGADRNVEPVTAFLRELVANDCSPLTIRSYAHDLLRWFRFLWTS